MLRSLIEPRGTNKETDCALLTPVFANMCFTEGSKVRIPTPFLNNKEDPQPCATSHKNCTGFLSIPGKWILHQNCLSQIMNPNEEVFICLILVKCIRKKLDDLRHEYNLDHVPAERRPRAWLERSNEAYDQIDYNFFFHHQKRVEKVVDEHDAKAAPEDRWYYFDYSEDFKEEHDAAADASIAGEVSDSGNDKESPPAAGGHSFWSSRKCIPMEKKK